MALTATASPDSPIAAEPPAPINYGCIDFLSYCPKLNGWIACGWIALAWDDTEQSPSCTLDFGDLAPAADGIMCLFPREDVRRIGTGFVLFVPGHSSHARRHLNELRLRTDTQLFMLPPSHNMQRTAEADAITRTRSQLAGAPRTERRARLLALLNRPSFGGDDTLHLLAAPIFMETDAVVLCPPASLLIRGWFADPFRQVAAIRLRCGPQTEIMKPEDWVRIPRPDVYEAMSAQHAGIPERCGFMAYVPDICAPGEVCYYEIETFNGDIAFKRLPPYRSPGLTAIKETLSVFDLRYQDMVQAYDKVVGPAITAMNRFRLEAKPQLREMAFGTQPAAPRCSIIIPLYGRIDFMEYQLAFFSRALDPAIELIYVLDDPRALRAAEILATACLARFERPFRLLTLSENVGYAPANNIGLAHARAPYVCYLNSDVFPKTPDWLDRMLETAQAEPDIGAVGALLLYEDNTIQHAGCAYEELAEFGGWRFALHPGKGRLPEADESLLSVDAVTGACMVVRTELARRHGGLDEGYVIGDFEDIDLCGKLRRDGLRCVVDRRAQLYHLERQSQGAQQTAWRLNLTLFNAWRFQKTLAAEADLAPPGQGRAA